MSEQQTPTEQHKSEFSRKIETAMKAAVAQAIEEHRRMGRSIVVERDGKIVTIPPEEIPPLLSYRAESNGTGKD